MESTPQVTDDVPEQLRRYDERITALERAVEELKSTRTALAQTPAQTTAQTTAATQAHEPAQHLPAANNQVTGQTPVAADGAATIQRDTNVQTTGTDPATAAVTTAGQTAGAQPNTTQAQPQSGGFLGVLPFIIAAFVWYLSDSFFIGVVAGIASGVVLSILRATFKGDIGTSPVSDAAKENAARTEGGGGTREPRQPRVKSDLEQSIGRYWYLWTGVALLVIGLGYGLMLAYEHIGPLMKIISWFAGAAALVAAGEYAHRKMSFKPFGLSLVGGGYAVAYFTIYAMQNIASVKVIDSVIVDSCLLLALAAGCMLHSMYRRSESIAILASLLAFVTISLSTVTAFSVVAAAVMVAGLAAVIVRMRWLNVYLAGTIGAYVTFALFTHPQIAASLDGVQKLLVSGAFLTAYWLAFNAVLFLIRDPEGNAKDRSYTLGVSVINAVAFVYMALTAMEAHHADWRYLFLFAAGAAYAGLAYAAHKKLLAGAQTLFTLVALMLTTAAFPLWLDATAVSAVWLLEVPLLVIAGLALKQPTFRAFAAGLTLFAGARLLTLDLLFGSTHTVALLGMTISWPVLIGVVGVFSFALAALAYRLPALADAQHRVEKTVAYPFYLVVSSAVAWMIPAVAAGPGSQSLWYAFEAAVLLGLAIKRNDRVAEVLSLVFFATSGVTLLLNSQEVGTIATYINVAVFFATSAFYKWNAPRRQDSLGYHFHHAYAIGATAVTWALTIINNSGDLSHLALWLSLESAVVVAVGFALKDGVFRQLGGIGLAGAYFATVAGSGAWTWSTTLPVIAALYALSFVYRFLRVENAQRPKSFADQLFALGQDENAVFRLAYAVAGTLLLFAVTGALAPSHLELWWAAEASVITAIGFALADREWRYMGALGFVATTVSLIAGFNSWTWMNVGPAALLFFAASFAYRFLPLKDSLGQDSLVNRFVPQLANEGELFSSAFAVVAAITTTTALYALLAWQWLAVAWSLEAICLLTIGVQLNDKVFRYSAHAVFGLMLGKLVLWDLRGAEQYVRVIIFIVAGIVSIAAAFIFARFEKKLGGGQAAQRNLTEQRPEQEDHHQ